MHVRSGMFVEGRGMNVRRAVDEVVAQRLECCFTLHVHSPFKSDYMIPVGQLVP